MAALVQPDTRFIQEVMASGGADLKKCYQCATCSVVCALAPEDAPFPRKQMVEAQWGLKDRLVADPAIWLCHHCGDCTTRCPRGARPGDVFGALRAAAIRHFAFPGWLGALAASPKGLLVLLLLPALVFTGMMLSAAQQTPAGEMEFAHLFPILQLEALFFAVTGLVVLAFAIGALRLVRALRAAGATGSIAAGLVPALKEIATHQRFAECAEARSRRLGHLLTLWGFMGLAFMGTVVGLGTMTGLMHTPLPLAHPLKIFANLCAAIILAGLVILLADRLADPAKRAASSYFDWWFMWTLLGVVVTGIASELLRLWQTPVMYGVYYVHLVLVFALFLYAPYTKFAHLLYRTLA
ncbi:MAG: hypothetical protein FJW34_14775, partial [Acidobacteria bacterium]|nr:hypothetical protein [Acidobacteriota bacterium]